MGRLMLGGFSEVHLIRPPHLFGGRVVSTLFHVQGGRRFSWALGSAVFSFFLRIGT